MSPITARAESGRLSIRPSRTWGSGPSSLQEAGNVKYDYYFDAQDPDALLLVETWETPETQQAHCQTELFARLQALKAEYCEHVTIDKFNY